ncbi:MAG TPA: nucleotide sugar dehydrogenase [Vicinamibacterales bacterium]|nr:nucleotide sugar dehydrogenase [Vicinamibacterales bacterium]
MRLNIYGLGYVGSVSAACLAADGHAVLGIDVDCRKVDSINRGESAVIEPGLAELIRCGVAAGRLRATTAAAEDADISMICVGTPSNENGSLCLDYVRRAAAQIGVSLRSVEAYHVVCVRSTILPGTVQGVVIPLLEQQSGKRAGEQFGVCMNPEFLREGSSIADFHTPPMTIIGELDARSGDRVAALYAGISGPIIRTKLAVAEMVKYAGNAYHGLKVTFANEVGNICKRLGLDAREVMEIFCRDQKLNISAAYLQPGFAFGGSCLPKDLRALLHRARELDLEPAVLRSVLVSNTNQIEEAYRLIKRTGMRKIAMLGLSFKPGTDDLRESPIAALVEILVGKGHEVAIYDREVLLARIHGSNRVFIEQTIPHISRLMKTSVDSALEDAEVIVIAKRSPEYSEPLRRFSNEHRVIDLASLFAGPIQEGGGQYEGICW